MARPPIYFKRSFITGVCGGLVMGAYLLLESAFGLHSEHIEIGQYTGYLRYLILLLTIILAIRYVRTQSGGEGMTFGRAFSTGIIVTLGTAIVMGAMEFLYTSVLFPDFFDSYLALQVEQMRKSGTSEAEIREMVELAKVWSTPGMNFLLYFIETTLIGTLFTLVSALFLKSGARQRPTDPAPAGV